MPTVAVITPERGAPQQEIVLPGTMQAFTDAPIYARTNGYLRKWYVDIGARVHAGQVLADIDTPEVDQQLEQARADLATAEANARLAQTTAERYRDLIKTDSVSQAGSRQRERQPRGARRPRSPRRSANVRRLEQLHAFGKITAPFDGVITARNIDVGALIDSGSNAKELFHVAAVHRLRVFVNVPEVYSRAATAGHDGRPDADGVSRPHLRRHAGADGAGHRRRVAHAADRDRRRQPEGRAAAGLVRRSPPEAADRGDAPSSCR